MRITRLLPGLCLLGSAACARAEILAPEIAPATGAQAAAADTEEPGLGPVVELENCFVIEIVEAD